MSRVSETENSGRTHANVNRACSRCHTGGRPEYANGTATWNSVEFDDAMKGHCYSQLKCVDCHNPHKGTGPQWPKTAEQDDQSCIRCHEQFSTPDEIEAFLNDTSKDAFGQLVNRLLNSEHYGEQWGRHWLDVVRYADSAGFANDFLRANAWRYRDYVIRSFNNDKPYDQFVREQVAGDELNPDDPESLIAVGFLRMGGRLEKPPTRDPKGAIDAGWDYMPGGSVSEELRTLLDQKAKASPAVLATAMLREAVPIDVRQFVERSMTTGDRKITLDLGTVKNVERIREKTGFDLTGFTRLIDNYGVRHTLGNHGDASKETSRGQLAVTVDVVDEVGEREVPEIHALLSMCFSVVAV